nr:hypothetical protein [Candidatus Kuenenia stuttgartiensis]
MTLLIYDNIYLEHDTGIGHPENARRIENTIKYLESDNFLAHVTIEKPRAALPEEIGFIHPKTYISTIQQIADSGGGWLDHCRVRPFIQCRIIFRRSSPHRDRFNYERRGKKCFLPCSPTRTPCDP